jgi:hypothetical protein
MSVAHLEPAVYVNNNGNLTFDAPLGEYTPFDLLHTNRLIVAQFFGDVDTRAGNLVTFGTGTVAGHQAFAANWPGVGCYATITSVLNFFQVVLINRSDVAPGDFDIEFNYKQIEWETGRASGGSSSCQGGSSARVGFNLGTGLPGTSFELAGSAVPGSFLDSNEFTGPVKNRLNSSQPGRYLFQVRQGVRPPSTPTGINVTVGDKFVLVFWNPAPEAIDRFIVGVSTYNGNTFDPIGDFETVPQNNALFGGYLFVDSFPNGTPVANGTVYSVIVRSEHNGVQSAPSDRWFAIPGQLAVPKPAGPLFFLHGFNSSGETFGPTLDFLSSTLV